MPNNIISRGAILDNMWIRAGSTNSMSGGTEVRIADVIKHPNYVETPRSADIAVIFLKEALSITNSINVLFIPPPGISLPDGMETKIVSWGFENVSQFIYVYFFLFTFSYICTTTIYIYYNHWLNRYAQECVSTCLCLNRLYCLI